MQSFRYGSEIICYEVRRQPDRSATRIAIHVEPDGNVIVDAPIIACDKDILTAVKRKARWIHDHVASSRQRIANVLPRDYVSGESVLYLGRRYRLKVIVDTEKNAGVRLWGGHIEVRAATKKPLEVRERLEEWLRSRAKVVIGERLRLLCATLRWVHGVPPTRFQAMKLQWGSCSPAGRLTLNPFLVKAPRECIDYVLLHELCHLKEHNHGRHFYKLLDSHLPFWRSRKERLDDLAELILNR